MENLSLATAKRFIREKRQMEMSQRDSRYEDNLTNSDGFEEDHKPGIEGGFQKLRIILDQQSEKKKILSPTTTGECILPTT